MFLIMTSFVFSELFTLAVIDKLVANHVLLEIVISNCNALTALPWLSIYCGSVVSEVGIVVTALP